MNNADLEKLLKSVPEPERAPEYWQRFPKHITSELRLQENRAGFLAQTEARRGLGWLRPALGFAAVGLCVLAAFFLGLRQGRISSEIDPQLAEAQKCFQEVSALFPHQLEALVLDRAGAHLRLADQPNVPTSQPLYVKISGPSGVTQFVTFSGQKIRVNGDSFEVLLERQGGVLLVGEQLVWSSSDLGLSSGPYRIEARPLPAHS